VYGATKQYAETIDTSPPLSKEDKKYVQEVVGTFLYYAQCVDSTMLTALGSIPTQQANLTKNTMIKVKQFLDYAFTHPNAIMTYQASDMVLAAHSDASYLLEANACSPQEDISSCPATHLAPITMAWSSLFLKSSSSHVLSSKGQDWSSLYQLSGSSPRLPHLRVLGASSTSHTNSNQQHNGARCHQ
jgi:hypothetical protein